MTKCKTGTDVDLSTKRKEWLEALGGEDKNSIKNQLLELTWHAAVYQVVNEARRLAPPAPEGGVQLNGLIHNMLDKGFFTYEMVGIRKLADSAPLDGKKGVYSLRAVLKDMIENRGLLTRKAMFDAEGLEYDVESLRKESWEYSSVQARSGTKGFWGPQNLNVGIPRRRHITIDRLTGVTSETRTPDDQVQLTILENLDSKVKQACEKITLHVNKVVAHAATPDSRAAGKADAVDLTLKNLWDAHASLCQAATFISGRILGDGCLNTFLAVPQFDQFAYIDRPLVEQGQVTHLRDYWGRLEEQAAEWNGWGWEGYEKEFGRSGGVGSA